MGENSWGMDKEIGENTMSINKIITYTYPKSIEEAAILLDEAKSGWEKEIIASKLAMRVATQCILGQLYKTYSNGMNQLFGCGNWTQPGEGDDFVFGTKANKEIWIDEINKRVKEKTINNFQWAIDQLHLLRKIKRKDWTGHYFQGPEGYICNNHGNKAVFRVHDLVAEDWEIIKDADWFYNLEPGQKFKFYTSDKVLTKISGKNLYIDDKFEIGELLQNQFVILVK